MEILAPVGNLENLKVAVMHGADAVYFSAGKFNARAKCQEINLQNLKECVEYAHLFNVKVYLTVNTIIKNEELEDLFETLKTAVEAKVDAFIIQDLAVYKILKDNFSDVVLHASTQMGIHNLYGAKFLEELGFSRVVLSRETSLEDIKQIHENTNLEIEYFVQGALCVAFSGNCYFSSIEKNASGNRGECLQLCRLMYEAKNNDKTVKQGYLLSPRDLCLIDNLKELENAGVCSLKIEGRLRRAGYVAQTIDTYKRALNNPQNTQKEKESLKKVFSRGDFNYGEYLNMGKDIIYSDFQNHMGIKIGKVLAVQKLNEVYKITIQTNGYQIKSNDGLKFICGLEQKSVGVGNVDYKNGNYIIYSKTKPNVNDIVNLTLDSENETKLASLEKKLPVSFNIKAVANQKLEITATCQNIEVRYDGEIVQEAKSSPLKYEDIMSSFSKLSDTEFELKNCVANLNNSFLAKSQINEARRSVIALLKNKIIENYNKKINAKLINDKLLIYKNEKLPNNSKFLIFSDFQQIKDINPNNKIFIFAPINYNNLSELNLIPNNYNLYLYLPIIANKYDIKLIDKIMESGRFIGVMANNYWGLKYHEKYRVICGYPFNVANDISKNILLLYADDIIESCEPKLYQNMQDCFTYQGKVALMTFAHCPQKTVYKKACSNDCKFDDLSYTAENGKSYQIRRTVLTKCYFELLGNSMRNFADKIVEDLR